MDIQTRDSRITIFGANFVFMLCIVLLVTVGAWVQTRNLNYGLLITEFVLIVIPVLAYIIIKSGSLKHVLRLNKLSFIDAILVLAIFLSGYFVAVFFGVLGNIVVSLFGDLIPSPIPIASNGSEYLVYILIIAGSAGLCEEILFRGLLLRAYEGLGKWASIGFTAFLFGIMHVNIQNLLGPMFLGVVLGYVVYHTDSIFAGMLGHFTNNAMAVSLSYALMKLPMYQNMDAEAMQAGTSTAALIVAAVVFGVVALFAGAVMIMCMLALKERSKHRQQEATVQSLGSILKSIRISWPVYVGVLVFVLMVVRHLVYISSGIDIIFILIKGV